MPNTSSKYKLAIDKQLVFPYFKKRLLLENLRKGYVFLRNSDKKKTPISLVKKARVTLSTDLAYIKMKPLPFARFKKRKQLKIKKKNVKQSFLKATKQIISAKKNDPSRLLVSLKKRPSLKKINLRFFLTKPLEKRKPTSLSFAFKKIKRRGRFFHVKRKKKSILFFLRKIKGFYKGYLSLLKRSKPRKKAPLLTKI